jgi:hypothetical protein
MVAICKCLGHSHLNTSVWLPHGALDVHAPLPAKTNIKAQRGEYALLLIQLILHSRRYNQRNLGEYM